MFVPIMALIMAIVFGDLKAFALYFEGNKTVHGFDEAKAACWSKNCELVSILNESGQLDIEDFVRNKTNSTIAHFFIDLKRRNFDQYRSVLNGTAADVKLISRKHFLLKSRGTFGNEDPDYKAYYLCETRGKCQEKHLNFEIEDICFEKNQVCVSWYEARAACIKNGKELATSHIREINIPEGNSYWLGYSRISWRPENNDTGEFFTKYTNWKKHSEHSTLEDHVCVLVGPDFTWQDSLCQTDKEVSVLCDCSEVKVPVAHNEEEGSWNKSAVIFVAIGLFLNFILALTVSIWKCRRRKRQPNQVMNNKLNGFGPTRKNSQDTPDTWHRGYKSTSFDDAKKCILVSSSKDYKLEAA